MTDRDTFAAAALTGLLASGEFGGVPTHYSPATGHAYAWADAMIRERQQRSRVDDSLQQANSDDITLRLTSWCHKPSGQTAGELMDEAAAEIERLRRVISGDA
jgi:hypothetical protein